MGKNQKQMKNQQGGKKQTSFSWQDLAAMKSTLFSKEEIQNVEAEERRKKEEAELKKKRELQANVQAQLKKTDSAFRTEISKIRKNTASIQVGGKSIAKAAGLKSTLILDHENLLMTSFGNGNAALPEKKIIRKNVQTVSLLPVFDARALKDAESFEIKGRAGLKSEVRNPLLQPDEDQLHLRKKLEEVIFGKTFEDNIHIQLAYNILDIDKILSIHINNIIYTINNLLREEQYLSSRRVDLFEKLSFAKTWERFRENAEEYALFMKLIQKPQLGYFGPILWNHESFKKNREKLWQNEFGFRGKAKDWKEYWNQKKSQITETQKASVDQKMNVQMDSAAKRAYTILSILGELRQSTAHGANRTWTAIYCLDEAHDKEMAKRSQLSSLLERKEDPKFRHEARALLEEIYSSRVANLNKGFAAKAKTDLQILFDVLGVHGEDEEIATAKDYYDFIVRKSYKNQGFSIKKLRQQIIVLSENETRPLNSTYFDSVRAKLNHMLDFVIFRMYQRDPVAVAAIVERLRSALSEEEKEAAYRLEAKRVWAEKRYEIMQVIVPKLEGGNLKLLKDSYYTLPAGALEDVFIPQKADCFTELVYLLTHFLDAKEINDLITTLINKFDNIASLLNVMKDPAAGLECQFTSQFSLFYRSAEIVKELKLTNSFARMTEQMPGARGAMFKEAAQILGYKMSETELENYVNNMLDTNRKDANGNSDTGFRNFIANNVIESDRFIYLVRYTNPKNLRMLAGNRKLISHVLSEIPDSQILRYYNSCEMQNSLECSPRMREVLLDRIVNMSFEDFEHVDQKARSGPAAREKESKKSIVRLYLTVMYLLVKNLVYVNSRYYLAFHCVERDSLIYDPSGNKVYYIELKDYNAFSRAFLSEYPHKPRIKDVPGKPPRISKVQTQLMQDFKNSDPRIVKSFRNAVEHMTAVMDMDKYIGELKVVESYYAVYQYIIQRALAQKYQIDLEYTGIYTEEPVNPKILEYFANIGKYGSYCKDFTKALCVPFAYNYPRFKNLTVDGQFDRNRPGTGKK